MTWFPTRIAVSSSQELTTEVSKRQVVPQRRGLCALQVRLRRNLLFAPDRQLLLQRLDATAAGRPGQGAAQPRRISLPPQAGASTPAGAAGPAARGSRRAAAAGNAVPREGVRPAAAGSVGARGGPGAAAAGNPGRGDVAMELGASSVPLQSAAHAEAHGGERAAAAAGTAGAHDGARMKESSMGDCTDLGADGVPAPPPSPPPRPALPPPPPLLGVPHVTPAQEPSHGAAAGSMHASAAGVTAAAVGLHAAADSSGAQAPASEQLAQQGQNALQDPPELEELTRDLSSLAAVALPGARAPSNGGMGEALGRQMPEKWCGPEEGHGEWARQKHACAAAEEGSKLHAPSPEVLERRVGSEGAGDRMNGALHEVAGEGGRSIVGARSAGPSEQHHADSGQCPPMHPRPGVPGAAGSQDRAPKAQSPSSLTALRSRKPSEGPAGGQRRSASPARSIHGRAWVGSGAHVRSESEGRDHNRRSRERQHSPRRGARRSREPSRSRSRSFSRQRSPRRLARRSRDAKRSPERSYSRSRERSRRRSPRRGSRDGSWEGRSPSRGHVRRAEGKGARQGADRRPPGRSSDAGSARAHEERATSGTPAHTLVERPGFVHAQEQPSGAQGAAPAAGGGSSSGRRVFDAAAGASPPGDGAAERGRGGGAAGAISNGLRAAQHQARADPAAASRLGPGQPAVRLCWG